MYVKFIPEQVNWVKQSCIKICLLFADGDFEDEDFWSFVIKDALINARKNFEPDTKFRVGLAFETMIDPTESFSFTLKLTKQSSFLELIVRLLEEFKKCIKELKTEHVDRGALMLVLCDKQSCKDDHLDLADLAIIHREERQNIIDYIQGANLPPHINCIRL